MSEDRLKIWLKNNLISNCLLFLSISELLENRRGINPNKIFSLNMKRNENKYKIK